MKVVVNPRNKERLELGWEGKGREQEKEREELWGWMDAKERRRRERERESRMKGRECVFELVRKRERVCERHRGTPLLQRRLGWCPWFRAVPGG